MTKKITVVSFLVVLLVSACSPPEEPKAIGSPSPSQSSSSVGRQYGETLKGGIDKAKDIQKQMGERAQQLDEIAKPNTPE